MTGGKRRGRKTLAAQEHAESFLSISETLLSIEPERLEKKEGRSTLLRTSPEGKAAPFQPELFKEEKEDGEKGVCRKGRI